jgi:hypothetical protein
LNNKIQKKKTSKRSNSKLEEKQEQNVGLKLRLRPLFFFLVLGFFLRFRSIGAAPTFFSFLLMAFNLHPKPKPPLSYPY